MTISHTSELIQGPFAEIPGRGPGTVVVAVGSKGAINVDGGRLTVNQRLFGGFSSFYLVDVSPRTIEQAFHLRSAQEAFFFDAKVRWDLIVTDPAQLVERGIRDLGLLVGTSVRNTLARVAGTYQVRDAARAEHAALEALSRMEIDPLVKVAGVTVDLVSDEEAAKWLRSVQAEELAKKAIIADSAVNKARRDGIREAFGSLDDLLAQLMLTKDEGERSAINIRLARADTEELRRMELVKVLIEGKIIEPHDVHARFPSLLEHAFEPTLPVAPEPPPKMIAGAVTVTAVETEESPARPPSRLRIRK